MSKRRCAATNCPKLIPQGNRYCPTHAHAHEQHRGTPSARGYGRAYQQARRQAAQTVAQGNVNCWRCGKPIQPNEPFDLGHDDNDRTIIKGPEHRRCNRRAGGKAAHPKLNTKEN